MVAFKPRNLFPWNSAFLIALLEAGVRPYNGYTLDHLEGTKYSASIFDNGKRHTSADLLKYANPYNTVVLLNATATRILFDSSSGKLNAVGAEFMSNNDGKLHNASTNYSLPSSEVILSAGSIGSPQLLLLSGVGPSEQLKELNISIALDLQSVGRDIRDPPRTTITINSFEPLEFAHIQVVGIIDDSQVYLQSESYFQKDDAQNNTSMGIFQSKVAFPLSSSELRLNSTNPQDSPPLVRYNYFYNYADVDTCIVAARKLSNLINTISIQEFAWNGTIQFIGPSLPPNPDDTALKEFCIKNVKTYWHYHGGCEVDSMIDKRFRVRGVDSLRVIDSSIFKNNPGTNPQATFMMLGRYAGVKIIQEHTNICEYQPHSNICIGY